MRVKCWIDKMQYLLLMNEETFEQSLKHSPQLYSTISHCEVCLSQQLKDSHLNEETREVYLDLKGIFIRCYVCNWKKNVPWITSVSPVLLDESITLLMLTVVNWLGECYFRL